MYKRENLVVLMYASNNCYTRVEILFEGEREEKGCQFKVNLQESTWQREKDFKTITRKIGESVQMEWGCRYGVIGVYDRTSIPHLNAMVSAACEATESQGNCLEED